MNLYAKLLLLCSIGVAFIAVRWSATSFNEESLKGARVLVTGASTGIGEQLAYQYARLGAQLVITARRGNVLEEVVRKCQEMGAQKAFFIPADMASPSDAERVVQYAIEQLGGLDFLVLNHIGPSPYSMWNGDVEHTRWLLQVNFLSYLQMAQKALPTLEKSKGSIVVVSSLLGKMCSPFALPYAATKFALNGFFGGLQHELAMQKSNVSITICILGLIDTDSAMEKIKGYINMTGYPAHESARHIIEAGASRQPEAFYPWYTFYACLFRDWFPYFRDLAIQNSYTYDP
ncbi:hydroxysteroid 11-beta-dehydrogenase 1-like protein [Rhinichthys klamathensis goyatoka]|uniref:hydroxysteroid 11-beta-dehydrogenase 1-like protein n=1 Tax=Rhinichthys klamathensis goyatoka TaxID=3034132 RepID=UPI0024B5858E|nr:hydroxysteroid 11-beta-dehydrogenase 1-like protein [Rhinichthys klamathensis goyatoka]